MATLCNLGRPEVAAACSFAAMLGGNVKAVKLITCTMVDQVRTPSIGLERTPSAAALDVTGASAFPGGLAMLWLTTVAESAAACIFRRRVTPSRVPGCPLQAP